MATQKQKLIRTKDEKVADIHQKYGGKHATQYDMVAKQDGLDDVAREYNEGLETLNQQIISEMQIELTQYKQKLQKERDLLRGKNIKDRNQRETNTYGAARKEREGRSKLEEKIHNQANDAVNKLNPVTLSAQEFKDQLAAIYAE